MEEMWYFFTRNEIQIAIWKNSDLVCVSRGSYYEMVSCQQLELAIVEDEGCSWGTMDWSSLASLALASLRTGTCQEGIFKLELFIINKDVQYVLPLLEISSDLKESR